MLTGHGNQSPRGIVQHTTMKLLAVALTCSLVAGCGDDHSASSTSDINTLTTAPASTQTGTQDEVDGGDEEPLSPAGIDTTLQFIELVEQSTESRTTRWEAWSDWPSREVVWLFTVPDGTEVSFFDLTGYPEFAPNHPLIPAAAPSCERDSDNQLRCLLTFPDQVQGFTADITIDLPPGVQFPTTVPGFGYGAEWTTTVIQNTATRNQAPRFELDEDRHASSNTNILLATG